MIISNTRLIKTCVFAFFLASCIFYSRPLDFSYAEDNELKEYFDYSGLSEEEKKEEVRLIYKYARKSYEENDIATAKELFYQVLELDPNHAGANKYLEYIIPKKLGLDKHSKAKEAKVFLDKREELEFKNLEDSIESARAKMESMEKDRLAREMLYKNQLDNLDRDVLDGKKPLSKGQESTKGKIRALEDVGRQAEEKLVNKLEKKEKTSWAMMAKELDRLQKKNKGLQAKRELKIKKAELKEKKNKIREQKKEDRIKKIEAKNKTRQEKRISPPQHKQKQDKAVLPGKKKEAIALKKEMIRQQRLINKPRQDKTDIILNKHRQKTEAALQKQNKQAWIEALYQEAVQCYKAKRYDFAKEAFSKIIEIDSRHVRALDYLYIHIPEAEGRSQIK